MTTEIPVRPSLLRRAVKPVVMLVVGYFAWQVATALVGAVDWAAVGEAFGLLHLWMALPLLGALLLRQLCNAVPLRRYVPGLRIGRSMANDLTANLVATAAPPPADIVLRVAMFRSWGLDPVMGMAGVTLNTVKFYAVRFLAPVLGLALVASQGVERRQWVVALLCGLVAAVMLGSLVMLLRGDHLAAWLGRTAGRARAPVPLVGRPRRVGDRDGRHPCPVRRLAAPRAGAVDARAGRHGAGRCADPAARPAVHRRRHRRRCPVVDVVGGFLLVYPLTLLPLFGFGVLDAILLSVWVTAAGVLYEPSIVAGMLVWRMVTIFGTLAARAGDAGLVAVALIGPDRAGSTVRGRDPRRRGGAMSALIGTLREDELLLVRETEPAAMEELDEDALLELHTRVRRARTKYTKLYRRQAAARVSDVGGRGKARPQNRRNAEKAEVFEEALARVSKRVDVVARKAAAELKAERLAAARKGSTGPSSAPAGRATSGTSQEVPRGKTTGGMKRDASSQAQGARRQAKRDSR